MNHFKSSPSCFSMRKSTPASSSARMPPSKVKPSRVKELTSPPQAALFHSSKNLAGLPGKICRGGQTGCAAADNDCIIRSLFSSQIRLNKSLRLFPTLPGCRSGFEHIPGRFFLNGLVEELPVTPSFLGPRTGSRSLRRMCSDPCRNQRRI